MKRKIGVALRVIKKKSITELKNYAGLCSCCDGAPTCAFPRESGRAVLECDEFGGTYPPLNHVMKHVETRSVKRISGQMTAAQSLGVLQGLCACCDGLNNCTYPKPEGGVWHCDEYC